MLTAQDNAAVVRAHYEAFNLRDTDKSLSIVTNDVKVRNIPFNRDYDGHKGYREFLDNWTTAMPDCKVQVMNVVAGDEWAAVEFFGRGTHTGPLTGLEGVIPPTQKKLDMMFCELLRVKDGQIAETRLYFDAATLLRQLGLSMPASVPVPQPIPLPVPSGR